MLQVDDVRDYFTRSATRFDSLYSEGEMGPVGRAINRRFRRDIYERYLLTIQHARRYNVASALDVGCGSGRYLSALQELGVGRLVGIDLSPTMIELARRYVRQDGSCELITGDFMSYRWDEPFDLVIAQGVFDYVADPLPFLRKMLQATRHSVVASFPSISFYRTPIRRFRYRLKGCPVYFYDLPRIQKLAEGAGFARHEIVKIKGAGQDYFVSFFV